MGMHWGCQMGLQRDFQMDFQRVRHWDFRMVMQMGLQKAHHSETPKVKQKG